MAKTDIKKTELVWPGKYDEEGKLKPVEKPGPYPFQIVEVVNEPRIGKEVKPGETLGLFDYWRGEQPDTFEEGWRNKLIWGDNKMVMSSLLENFAGKIDLIYIDPPFATGADFTVDIPVGEGGETLHKEHSIIEEKAYRDTWGSGLGSYLEMIYNSISLMKELLNENGNIFVHLDWHVGHYVKVILDEIFNYENFINEIIWRRAYSHNDGKKFGCIHDIILWYSKGKNYKWNRIYLPYDKEYIEKNYPHIDEKTGKRYRSVSMNAAGSGGPKYFGDKLLYPPPGTHWRWSQDRINEAIKNGVIYFTESGVPRYKQFLDNMKGLPVQDIWSDFMAISSQSDELLPFKTQKPEALLERIIRASSNEGDLVADFFCGSGTTCAVAEKLGRRWIGVDLSRYAIHTTRKRLLEIEHSKSLEDPQKKYGKKARPFEILNLGKYERQFWQVKAFGKKDEKEALYEYLAFILKLYEAEPISGSSHIHGKKGNALVYIGAVDAPVTIQEVIDALKETRELGLKELHVLGWEWEMGLNDAIQEVAKDMGIRLKLRIIPMDVTDPQAVEKGDIRFFELAYFKADIKVNVGTVNVKLEDFVIPHTDLIPREVQDSIQKWSDWIDYWAIDFDFRNDTFNNSWTSYRTKKNRQLVLEAEHKYEKPGKYKIFIKIIDIFGIDTSQIYEIEVK